MWDKFLGSLALRQISALKKIPGVIKNGLTAPLLAIAIVFELLGVALFDLPMTPRGEELDLDGYKLVFEDNFNGTELNTDVWAYRANGPRRSGFNTPTLVRVEDGNLILGAKYLPEGDGTYGEGWYGSMINIKQEFTRGYFECRCICSQGGGFWSAFWLNSSGMSSEERSNGGIGGAEVDIFEAFNYGKGALVEDSISSNIHVGGYGDGLRSLVLGRFKGNNIYEQYNTYGLEWTQDEYIFYINGVETVRSSFKDGVSQAPEYVILSMEIPEKVTAEKDFSCDFIVDYVKVYQR